MTHYAVLHKGDTISIQYSGRDYLIDIVDTKPEDQVCCVEADIELEFEAPKDYKEQPAPTMKKTNSEFEKEEMQVNAEKLKEIEQKYTRIDGKKLTEK